MPNLGYPVHNVKELYMMEASIYSTVKWAFLQNYHADMMNACIHEATVKFSPLTFSLAACVRHVTSFPELTEVIMAIGTYELDHGR